MLATNAKENLLIKSHKNKQTGQQKNRSKAIEVRIGRRSEGIGAGEE